MDFWWLVGWEKPHNYHYHTSVKDIYEIAFFMLYLTLIAKTHTQKTKFSFAIYIECTSRSNDQAIFITRDVRSNIPNEYEPVDF